MSPAASTTTQAYDAIVVGGGHNGLTHAAYLAKAGLRTLVLERQPMVGGAAITEELVPGFSFTTFSYALSLLRPEIVQELELVRHGFLPLTMPSSFHPTGDGGYLLFGDDHAQNVQEIRRHSPRDADAYERYHHDLDRVVQAVRPLFDSAPPDVFSDDPEDRSEVEWLLKHLGGVERRVMHDVVRLLTGSASDWLGDYFAHEAVKGYHASSSIIGSKVGPMSPGSGLVLLFHKMGEHDGHLGSWAFHKGGNGGFTQVLARAAEAFGAEIRLGSPVTAVLTEGERAVGVALEDGTELGASVVVSALDPRRTFLELVEPRALPGDLVDSVERMKFRGVSAKVNFALDGLPTFPALPDTVDHFGGFLNIGPTIEYVERAFDAAKYGWYSERPFVDAAVQSVVDPDMAPPGKHVLSCFVQYAPYELRGSDWETERQRFGDTAQAVLEEHFPGFGELVLHREVVTPVDIEERTGLSEGNIFAGEFLAPQMYVFRPAPGWSRYATPIRGYYQCGSGTHPGGCVIGSPGRLASQRVLADLGAGRVPGVGPGPAPEPAPEPRGGLGAR